MKKVLSIIFVAFIMINVFLACTKDVSKKNTFSFGMLIAKADGSDGEDDPFYPPIKPIPFSVYPDSTIIYIFP